MLLLSSGLDKCTQPKKLVAFAEKNSAELAGYHMQTAGGTPAEVKAILDNPLFQSLVDEGYDVSSSGIVTIRLPPLPGIERSKFSTPNAHHHQLLDLFLSSAEFVANLAERNPRIAQLAVAGLQSALMGPMKMIQGAVQDYFFGETIANFKEIATRFVSDKLMIQPQYVELAGSAAYMGVCFAFAGATKVVNAAQEVQQSVGKIERKVLSTNGGRAGRQNRLKALANDPKVSSRDRGWIKQEMNAIDNKSSRLTRKGELKPQKNIRVPPGKELAHKRGKPAKDGYSYEHSDLQDIDLHKLQHKHERF